MLAFQESHRGALGDETFAQLRQEGARLRWEDVDAIAFAAEDAV